MPMWQARLIFKDALDKRYLDSILANREGEIIRLEFEKNQLVADYEVLLLNADNKSKVLSDRLDNVYKQVENYKEQLQYTKRKNLWANIKFYAAVVALSVVSYLAITN